QRQYEPEDEDHRWGDPPRRWTEAPEDEVAGEHRGSGADEHRDPDHGDDDVDDEEDGRPLRPPVGLVLGPRGARADDEDQCTGRGDPPFSGLHAPKLSPRGGDPASRGRLVGTARASLLPEWVGIGRPWTSHRRRSLMPTVADYVLARLREWGTHRVFGYPGDGINAFLGALDRSDQGPEFIQTRHEEMAAFMASGHAKFTSEVGVCLATSGGGATHLLNGLYDAKLDRQPVVAIVGQQKRMSLGGR